MDEAAGWGWGAIGGEVTWSTDVLGALLPVILHPR